MAHGSVRLTADGAIGRSGSPVRVYTVLMLSASGGAGELVLRNGTTDSGTLYLQEDGTAASHTKTYNLGEGVTFPGGCFFDKDAATDAVVVEYEDLAG